jgi:hypothetical protein
MRGDRRAWYATLVATLVVLVLTGGVLGAIAAGPAPAGDRTVVAAGDGVAGVPADTTVTTSTIVPVSTTVPPPLTTAPPVKKSTTPTTRRPATTVTTQPTAAAPSGPVIRSTAAGYGMKNPGAVEIPFSPGRTSWSAVSNGVNISVRVDNAYPKAGDLITFDFDFSGTVQPCCNDLWIAFGDGYAHNDQLFSQCPPGGLPPGGLSRFTTTHTYNLDGRWTLAVQPGAGCGAPRVEPVLFFTMEIAPGTTTIQGPSLPQLRIDYLTRPAGHEDDHSWVKLAMDAFDDDGWVRTVTVDWGDGSPAQTFTGGIPCTVWRSGWPAPSRILVFEGNAHHYLAPGSYTITVTALSTACDGVSAPQTGRRTVGWQVPA